MPRRQCCRIGGAGSAFLNSISALISGGIGEFNGTELLSSHSLALESGLELSEPVRLRHSQTLERTTSRRIASLWECRHAGRGGAAQRTFGEFAMKISSTILPAILLAASAPWLVASAAAGPISSPLGLRNAVAPSVETVQYRRGWRGGYRGGYREGYRGGGLVGAGLGLGLGIAAGVGGAIVGATQPYGYYDYAPGYAYGPGYSQGYAGGDEVAYCIQRFRSYDPGSGTYLGFDGLRRPCP